MTSPLAATPAPLEPAVRGMERQLMTLLRRLRNPRVLAASPLMDAVCRATGERNAVAALQQVVGAALAGEDQNATRLRSAILEADFKRTSNAELARRSGVSRRHFQRWRAQAVTAIARYACEILDDSYAEPIEPAGRKSAPKRDTRCQRHDGAWRFKKEREAFLRARDRASLLEMRSIAASLLRLAESRDARVFAWQCMAEANLHLGKADEGIEQLQRLPPNSSLLLIAKLALLQEHFEAAEEYAKAALAQLNDGNRYHCLALIAQIRLVQCTSWQPPLDAASLPPCSWDRTAMEVAFAQHLGREGKWHDAEELALSSLRRSDLLGFQGLASRCAAVLHASAEGRGEIEQARRWRARTIEGLLATQDRLLATGLFISTSSSERLAMDRCLTGVLYERLCLVVPQMQGETETQRSAVCKLLAAILDARSLRQDSSGLERVIGMLALSDSAFVHYAEKLLEPIHAMLALTVVALTGSPWNATCASLRDRLAEIAFKLRPAAPRTIAIAIPRYEKSQPAGTDHLRVDDKPSAVNGESVEALANLRVRILPLRSRARTALPRRHGDSAPRAAGAVAGRADSC